MPAPVFSDSGQTCLGCDQWLSDLSRFRYPGLIININLNPTYFTGTRLSTTLGVMKGFGKVYES